MGDRRGGDAEMHLLGAGFAHHLHDLHRGRTADDGVVDEHDPFAADDRAIGAVSEEMRKCTSLAPASRIICTIFTEVVPRTMESSMSTIRLPLTTARLALCLRRTPSCRMWWLGSMKVRPT